VITSSRSRFRPTLRLPMCRTRARWRPVVRTDKLDGGFLAHEHPDPAILALKEESGVRRQAAAVAEGERNISPLASEYLLTPERRRRPSPALVEGARQRRDVFASPSAYRGGLTPDTAFLLQGQDGGIWMLVGKKPPSVCQFRTTGRHRARVRHIGRRESDEIDFGIESLLLPAPMPEINLTDNRGRERSSSPEASASPPTIAGSMR